jgi:hypothetical protein
MDITELQHQDVKRHPWELARFEIMLHLINLHLPSNGNTITIADVGCGDCYFSLRLLTERQDMEIIGIDPAYSPDEVKEKNIEFGSDRFRIFRNVEDAANVLNEKKVRAVLLLDVIEHIEQDLDFLRTVSKTIKGPGELMFFITVPAFQSLFSEHDTFLKHYRRYSHRSLKQTISGAGLQLIDSGYFFASLLPVRVLQKLVQKTGVKAKPRGIGAWNAGQVISDLSRKYLLFDYHFTRLAKKAGIRLPGLSVYSICKRPLL